MIDNNLLYTLVSFVKNLKNKIPYHFIISDSHEFTLMDKITYELDKFEGVKIILNLNERLRDFNSCIKRELYSLTTILLF